MIGTHSVKVYGDLAAATWVSLASNSGFDASWDGWTRTPWGSGWTWVTGGFVRSDNPEYSYQGIERATNSPILMPANVGRWRVRVRFTLPSPAQCWWGVYAGRTPEDILELSLGHPQDEDHSSVQNWTWGTLPAGTHTLESTWDGSRVKPLPYVAPHVHFSSTTAPMEVDFLDLSYRSNAGEADLSCHVDEISIQHGRADTTSPPEASSATIDLTVSPDTPLPSVLDVGAVIVISTRLPDTPDAAGVDSIRFSGRVMDVNLGWDEAGEKTPDAGTGQVVAVGPLSELGRRVVGSTPFPQELDGARVSRIMTLAGYTLDPVFSDPGTVQILPRDIDSRAALEVATETAQSAGGMVWQTRDGGVRYADADHRRGGNPALTLDACDLLVTPVWVRNMDGLINEVSIGYGVSPEEGGEQPRYVAQDDASRTKWGRFAISTGTELAALADAQAMGLLLLTRNKNPAWVMSAIPVDVAGLDAARTGVLLGLDMHALIRLTGLPAIGTAPTSFPAWIEGWRERLAWGVHDLELVISDYCRTSPPPRWNDLPSALTWDSVAASMTWDAAACLGPIPSEGRWDDISASLRWDQIDPAITWDSWKA